MLAAIARLSPRFVAICALLAAAFALGLALASEYWGGLLPCSLCLLERWPYRLAIGLAAVALIVPRRAIAPLLWLIVLAMLANTVLAVIHVGVEQHLWDNPIGECAAPHLGGSITDMLLQLSNRPPMPCDRASYLVPFIPLSMAAMNALFAAAFAIAIAVYLLGSGSLRRDALQPAIMTEREQHDC